MAGRKMKKTAKLMTVIFIMTTFANACSYRDIDKRVFVTAIGIDYSGEEENPYKVTLQLILPPGNIKEKGIDYSCISEKNKSISEAVRILKSKTDKELDYSHTKIVILGKELLKKRHIEEITDFFNRRRDIQLIGWIAVGDPSAEKVLKMKPDSEKTIATSLINYFSEDAVQTPLIGPVYLFDLRRKVVEKGIDPVLPLVQLDKKENEFLIDQSVIVSDKPIELDRHQTKLFNSINKNIDQFYVSQIDPDFKYTLFIDEFRSKYKIKTGRNQKPAIHYQLDLSGIVEESSFNIDPKKLDVFAKETGEYLKREIMQMLEFFQKSKVDPLGFGLRYKATRLHNRDTFKEWEEIYPGIDFDVDLNLKLKSTGTIK